MKRYFKSYEPGKWKLKWATVPLQAYWNGQHLEHWQHEMLDVKEQDISFIADGNAVIQSLWKTI